MANLDTPVTVEELQEQIRELQSKVPAEPEPLPYYCPGCCFRSQFEGYCPRDASHPGVVIAMQPVDGEPVSMEEATTKL